MSHLEMLQLALQAINSFSELGILIVTIYTLFFSQK